MFRFISETFHRLIDELPFSKTRYLYSSFELSNRLTGLVGSRGVGKTTLLLQCIKNELYRENKSFYFSADLVYFQQANLLEFVKDLHVLEGYQTIFIDEIHKYQNWNQELKNIYDSFPSLKIVFSGSPMLDLVEGSHDLSRRAKLYRLHGMSFREYLNLSQDISLSSLPLQDLLQASTFPIDSLKLPPKIFSLFNKYLKEGFYPFIFEDSHSYHEKITRIIEKTIFEDIAGYYSLKTQNLHIFKKVLVYFASILPGEVSIHSLAKHLGIDHKTVEHYLHILVSVGLLREMNLYEGGGSYLRKPSKFVLNNTNLMHTMQQYVGQSTSKGMERELFFIQSMQSAGEELFYSKQGDYRTSKAVFEVGGKNKTRKQINKAKLPEAMLPAYHVKDEILQPLKGEIPLFLTGFLY